jgi:hypothetical protein
VVFAGQGIFCIEKQALAMPLLKEDGPTAVPLLVCSTNLIIFDGG